MDNLEKLKATLSKLLHEEIECANILLRTLQAEHKMLVSADPRLEELDSSDKIKQIEALQLATRSRLDYTVYMENASSELDTQLGTSGRESDIVLNALKKQLSLLGRDCYNENQIIGQLINRRTQFITQVLNSLSPSASNPFAMTYGENGNTTSDPRNSLFELAQT